VRIIIECPENILHLKAGYIYADCLFDSSTLLQSDGGPYIFDSYPFVQSNLFKIDQSPTLNYTCAHLIKSKEDRWQPQEFPNQPPKTQ
jgi:hypothetical protein